MEIVIGIFSFIDDREVTKTILNHLGLCFIQARPYAKAYATPSREYTADGPSHNVLPDISSIRSY